MSKPKFVKPLLIGVACTIPVGLVVGLSVNWDHTQFIAAVGSSGVKPFIENFGKEYHKVYKNYDVTVESGGTAFAVEEVAKGYANLGNASNNPKEIIEQQGYTDLWGSKKTFTLGWEGLCLMYSLPDGLSDNARKYFNIVIHKDNILQLYGVFSCIHELKNADWEDKFESLWFYASDEAKAKITKQSDIDLLSKTKILPFVRSGGNTAANSSIAFTYYSHLAEFADMTESQQKAFAGGQYGKDSKFVETDESNARAWQSFVATNKPGSMVYLTTSFLINEDNRKEMEKYGYKLAGYKYADREFYLNDVKDLNRICTADGYNWYRPIDVMIDLNVQKSKDFIYWIYTHTLDKVKLSDFKLSNEYSETVAKLGAKPLTIEQFQTMLPDANESTIYDEMFSERASDMELASTRTDFADIYGAGDIWES